MATVMFVHGTGVREPAYSRSLQIIADGLAPLRPDLAVAPCYWGGSFGATLHMNGRSIPGYHPANEDTVERERWATLYRDPLFEIRLLYMTGRGGPPFAPAADPPGAELSARVRSLADDPAVRDAFAAAGLGSQLAPAIGAVLDSAAGREAFAELEDITGSTPAIVARAVVAHAVAHAADGPTSVRTADRDTVLAAVLDGLGGPGYGVVGDAAGRVLRVGGSLALRFGGSRWVVSQRNAWSEETQLFAGDILYYLARGQAIREFIARQARAVAGPVVLLAHSLGGIAAVDLLAERALPEIELLVTVGTQAPLLYEFDALPCLPYGQRLPDHFPRWVNIFDRRDLLSYVGQDIFPSRVVDVEVDNGQAVSLAHSGYWTNNEVYRLLAQEVANA